MSSSTPNTSLPGGYWRQPADRRWVHMNSLAFEESLNGSNSNDPMWVVHEGIVGIPSSLASPSTSSSPMEMVGLNNRDARLAILRPRQNILESNSRLLRRQPMPMLPPQEESKLTSDEQNNVLKKLRREIYNPIPMRIIQRLGLYYRDNKGSEKAKEASDDEGSRCAICLEDFETKQMVMVTPCSHMFHEECILPWLKSQGQCPVCRSYICDQRKESTSPSTSNASSMNMISNDPFSSDLLSLVRAVRDARSDYATTTIANFGL